jgi:hypothetical protein
LDDWLANCKLHGVRHVIGESETKGKQANPQAMRGGN